MEPSSPFLKILPYEVQEVGWMGWLAGHQSPRHILRDGTAWGGGGRLKNIIIICLFALVLFSSFYYRLRLVEQDIERI